MELWAGTLMLSAALIWGATDALMKYFSPASKTGSGESGETGLLSVLVSLLQSPSYLACLLLNQAGSVLYYWSLAVAPLSLVVPTVNTGKFLVNAVVGRWLGEERLAWTKIVGLVLMAIGVLMQITS